MTGTGPVTGTVLVALFNLGLLAVCYWQLRRFGTAAGFLGLVLISIWGTEYSLRPIRVAIEGEFGRETGFLHRLDDIRPDALGGANLMSLASTVALTFALVTTTRRLNYRLPSTADLSGGARTLGSSWCRRRLRLPVVPLVVLTLFASAAAALQMGTLGGVLNGESGRQNLSSGYLYLLVNIGGLTVLVLMVSLRPEQLTQRKTGRALAAAYVAFAGTHLLILGGRAEVIIVTIAAVIIFAARTGRPRTRVLVLGLLIATVVLGVHRVTTREAFGASSGQSQIDLALQGLRDPLDLVTRYDVSAYDKLILLEDADLPLAVGGTYVPAISAALPGARSNGLEGGNRVFTRLFIPGRYERGVTFEGISMLDEARYNFGWIGPPLVAAVTGWALGWVASLSRRGPKWQLTSALVVGILPGFVRADALNTATLGGSLIIFTLVLHSGITRLTAAQSRESRPATASGPNVMPGFDSP